MRKETAWCAHNKVDSLCLKNPTPDHRFSPQRAHAHEHAHAHARMRAHMRTQTGASVQSML